MQTKTLLWMLALGAIHPPLWAQNAHPSISIGRNWAGLSKINAKTGAATLKVPGSATFLVPNGPLERREIGFNSFDDDTIDFRPWYGISLEIRLERAVPFEGEITLALPDQGRRHNLPPLTKATFSASEKGWRSLTIPIESFDFNRGQSWMLRNIQQMTLTGRFADGQKGHVVLRNLRLVRKNALHLESAVRSAPSDATGIVSYTVIIRNDTPAPQNVALGFRKEGWEGMTATVSPANLRLAAGQSETVRVRVSVPQNLPGGAHEKQILTATASSGIAPATLELTTVRKLAHPYLVYTDEDWDEVCAKVVKYDWAKQSFDEIVASADKFEVPGITPGGIKSDNASNAIYRSYIEQKFWPVAIAYKLTGERKYADKIALLLRQLADPDNGFPKLLHANSQGIPQEGGFFEGCARAYDLIYDSGALSDKDKTLIENTFRLYIDLQLDSMQYGGISNWSLFNYGPAAQCALVLQDMERFNAMMYNVGGVVDHLRYGMMDDGWWYEMSLGYNIGCAEQMTNLGLAARPFGIDFLNQRFPAPLTSAVGLRPWEAEGLQGMAFGKFGPLKNNDVTLKRMWDSITVYPDYRGIVFGIGDGKENNVAGGAFETAYYAFRDPAYAAILKQGIANGNRRDLIFGVPELPIDTPLLYTMSGHSDNAGIAVLRSQTANRAPREQIQTSFKYGTHGGFHGHFDRLALNSISRYGRSFWHPETSWFGYGHYGYKMWVQSSPAHNMVIVDGKMQEPKSANTLLFHSGPMMQAIAAQTIAKWSNPPYLGGYDMAEAIKKGDQSYIPIPENHPEHEDVTGYTEPVRQRRLMVVTDDYILLADDLKAENEHNFDNFLHLRGAQLENKDAAQFLSHSAQFTTDPLSSSQFISDVNRYAVSAPTLVTSQHLYRGKDVNGKEWNGENWDTGGGESLSSPGVLNLDEYVLWPLKAEIAIGNYAETWWNTHKKLSFAVEGDGKLLASGTFASWILGNGAVNVDVSNLKALTLKANTFGRKGAANNVFWGGAVLVSGDGKETPLSALKFTTTNILSNPNVGRDYNGGPIRISGNQFSDAVAFEPKDPAQEAVLTLDLSGLNAARFKATFGGDWVVGNGDQLRKVVAVRSTGRTAQFLTLIEPHEGTKMVKSAVALSPYSLHVELSDGRVQDIKISGFHDDESKPQVTLIESKNGQISRQETAGCTPAKSH